MWHILLFVPSLTLLFAAACCASVLRDKSLILGALDRFFVWGGVGILLVASIALAVGAASADVPPQAERYRGLLTRTAHAEAGLSAPVSTFAAQIQQESAWNPKAQSDAGASGLSQFMPDTADWIGDIDTRLTPADVYNPGWALRALVVYDLWLHKRITSATDCDRWAMTLSAYNGGLGWVYRDQKLASSKGLDELVWFDTVERVNAGRSTSSFTQNRAYPRRILLALEPQYVAAGWGAGVCESAP